MSWDVLVLHVPPNIPSAKELKETYEDYFDAPEVPLGPRNGVLALLASVVPEANFSDDSWVTLDAKGYSVEFSLGKDDPTKVMWLHVRGGRGAEIIPVLQRLCLETGWRVFDTGTGQFIDFENHPDEGFLKWFNWAFGGH